MNALAATYNNLGRHKDALAMGEQVLEFRRRVLPSNHPEIGEGSFGSDALHDVCWLWRFCVIVLFYAQARPWSTLH